MTDTFQFRFPRSKKKRIREKWAKKPENWRTVPKKEILRLPNGDMVMHPSLYAKIKNMAGTHDFPAG